MRPSDYPKRRISYGDTRDGVLTVNWSAPVDAPNGLFLQILDDSDTEVVATTISDITLETTELTVGGNGIFMR